LKSGSRDGATPAFLCYEGFHCSLSGVEAKEIVASSAAIAHVVSSEPARKSESGLPCDQFATAPELRNDSLHHYSTISMSLSQTEILRRLRFPGYLVLALLAGLPILELGANAWPLQLHLAAWRFTVAGAAAAASVNSLLGLFVISVIAVASGDRAVVLFVAIASALAGALCLVGAGMLPLDALQLRSQVPADRLSRFNLAWCLALFRILATMVVFIVLSVHAFRASRNMGSTGALRGRAKASSLVVPGTANRVTHRPTETTAN